MCFHSVSGGGKASSAANLPTDSSREEAEYTCKLLWAIGPLSPGVASKVPLTLKQHHFHLAPELHNGKAHPIVALYSGQWGKTRACPFVYGHGS